ncbi:unnamed protein product [Menidia menidia]|uniref:(Atlantic silverside) hypothetical protein n=1 Tax=Menidia menidia TaxID=238744 RepID=A0A8S4BPX8_9TELE|nr:unnamed protein product [Menidia menidia]
MKHTSSHRFSFAAKPSHRSAALQRTPQASRRKPNQRQPAASSDPHPGPPSILLSDTTMTPWGGLAICESSFTTIPPPPPPLLPPAPMPTPPTSPVVKQEEDEDSSCSSFASDWLSPPLTVSQRKAGEVGKELGVRRRVLPQRRVPRPPRLPPLRPITNLSFSRSFTFSFFELPLHQSPRCRAERVRNLLLLLKQIHY